MELQLQHVSFDVNIWTIVYLFSLHLIILQRLFAARGLSTNWWPFGSNLSYSLTSPIPMSCCLPHHLAWTQQIQIVLMRYHPFIAWCMEVFFLMQFVKPLRVLRPEKKTSISSTHFENTSLPPGIPHYIFENVVELINDNEPHEDILEM